MFNVGSGSFGDEIQIPAKPSKTATGCLMQESSGDRGASPLYSVTFREHVKSEAQKEFIPSLWCFLGSQAEKKAQSKGLLAGPIAPTLLRQQPLSMTPPSSPQQRVFKCQLRSCAFRTWTLANLLGQGDKTNIDSGRGAGSVRSRG